MDISFTFKKLIIAITIVTMVVVAFLVHALAGLYSHPVVFADPPAFVEHYAAEMYYSDPSPSQNTPETGIGDIDESELAKQMTDLSNEEALVFKAIMQGESLDEILRLFTHPERAQRVKIAAAYATVDIKFTHDEQSGFPEKRNQFHVDVEAHLPDIRNALSEALIASAEKGTVTRIPYTLAWLPGQGRETVELLAWAAQHHPDWWVRRFSVYFVVQFGGFEELSEPLLRNRTHDPDYRVRKQVLDLQFSRFTG